MHERHEDNEDALDVVAKSSKLRRMCCTAALVAFAESATMLEFIFDVSKHSLLMYVQELTETELTETNGAFASVAPVVAAYVIGVCTEVF